MKQTMQLLKCLLVFLLVELLCWQVCFAQVDPWERIKLIEQGKKLSVKLNSGKSVNGKMEAWSTAGITLRQGKDRIVPVAKTDVTRVAIVSGPTRVGKALIGSAAMGGGAGVILSAGCPVPGVRCEAPIADRVGTLGLFVGALFLVWAIFPQHKEVVYTAAGPAKDR